MHAYTCIFGVCSAAVLLYPVQESHSVVHTHADTYLTWQFDTTVLAG